VSDLRGRYAALRKRLVDAVLTTPGATPSELRRAVAAGAERESAVGDIPAALAAYVEKVARHAYKVTDDEVAALQRAGHSDDALFEVTVAAALGAALGRLERGLAALRGEEPVPSPPDPLSGPHPLAPSPFGRGGTQQPR
jgi:alkylhydroperoxidase family enzyme